MTEFEKKLIEEKEQLKTELENLKIKLETWYQLLSFECINSKAIVKNEIKKVLEEK
jgi:hypothetical protein